MIQTLQKLEEIISTHSAQMLGDSVLLDDLCGLLQVQLFKVGAQMDADTANNVLRLIKMLFDRQGQVTMNGLIAFQGFIVGIENLGQQVNVG